jgi:hypothetical protein
VGRRIDLVGVEGAAIQVSGDCHLHPGLELQPGWIDDGASVQRYALAIGSIVAHHEPILSVDGGNYAVNSMIDGAQRRAFRLGARRKGQRKGGNDRGRTHQASRRVPWQPRADTKCGQHVVFLSDGALSEERGLGIGPSSQPLRSRSNTELRRQPSRIAMKRARREPTAS